MKIFVHRDDLYGDKWYTRYNYLLTERYRLDTRLIDFLNVPVAEIAPQVSRGDGLIGRWGHLRSDIGRLNPIVDVVTTLFGGRMFPAPNAYLYYDNKFRQASLFLNRGYPTPAAAVVGSVAELEAFLARESLSLPIVVKEPCGAQSSGVKLLLNPCDAKYPCLAQRYCPGNTCDFRICVIGHRVMGFMRRNRKNDFRASGSKDVVFVEQLDSALVALAYRMSSENNFACMAYDFVKLREQWVVLEMSYTFPHSSLHKCKYYYDMRTGDRMPKVDVYPEDLILEDFLAKYYPDVRPVFSSK